MPDYFNGCPIFSFTPHFLITYTEGDTDSFFRASAIAATCERDLQTLQKWFDCDYNNSPYGIWVAVAPGVSGGGASNFGFTSWEQSATMTVNGTYTPASSSLAENMIRDEVARMLFVGELAEILMDFVVALHFGIEPLYDRIWDRHMSSGEALSRIAAAELHPKGYYAPGYGPYANAWLRQGGRPLMDYVTNNDPTDGNSISYACGIVFFNYLAYQLGFSFPQIVQAGGPTLADAFSRLTGRAGPEAFSEFESLLEAHIISTVSYSTLTDNIFPLSQFPTVGLLPSSTPTPLFENTFTRDRSIRTVTLKPGPLCSPKEYKYATVHVSDKIKITAVTRGLAQASFVWTFGGVTVSAPASGFTTIDVKILHTTPADETPFFTKVSVAYYLTVDSNTRSTLQFWNDSEFPGIGTVDVSVVATETGLTPSGSAADTYDFKTLDFEMDDQWTADFQACNRQLSDAQGASAKIREFIAKMGNVPDPPPDQYRLLASQISRYDAFLKEITKDYPGLERNISSLLSRTSAVPEPAIELPGNLGGLPIRILRQNALGSKQEPSK